MGLENLKNMGVMDRAVRVIVALVIAGLYLMGVINGTLAIILLAVSIIFLLTSIMGFCPLYKPFNFTTHKK